MPVTMDPEVATQLAGFGEAANPAASIRYDVPLPGAHSFQHVLPLEVPSNWFDEQEAMNAGTSLEDLGVITVQAGGVRSVDSTRLFSLYQRLLPATARPSLRIAAEVGVNVVEPLGEPDGDRALMMRLDDDDGRIRRDADIALGPEGVEIQRARREQFLEKFAEREAARETPLAIRFPVPGLGQSIQTVAYDTASAGTPQFAIVETWQVSVFLGDYGLGKTLQTFSLLPGERTTITFDSWRTDSATREDASSVFDSSDTAAQSRYGSALASESGSATQSEANVAASFGTKGQGGVNFGIWNLGGSHEVGIASSFQAGRQQFAQSVSQTNQDHSSQVNASRRQTVDARSSTTSAAGTTQTTVREISNTNLRRVLNFVFRELNQKYEVITSLRDVRIAFYNGKVDSAEIVPLADLRRLLNKYIRPERREELARSILAMVTDCIDYEGTVRTMLEVGTRKGGTFEEPWALATLRDDGTLNFDESPLDGKFSWRIKRGPIGQNGEDHNVPGVVTARDTIVLRTDNTVVEALLGQADALDPYASALQALDVKSREADIEGRKAETRRIVDALNLVRALPNDEKVDAFERLLGEEPDIEVVPVAAVNNDGNP